MTISVCYFRDVVKREKLLDKEYRREYKRLRFAWTTLIYKVSGIHVPLTFLSTTDTHANIIRIGLATEPHWVVIA